MGLQVDTAPGPLVYSINLLETNMEIQITDTRWPKTLFDDEGDERRPGVHLGAVIQSLKNAAGLGYKGDGFNDMQLTAEIGLLWENVLGKVMREKYAVRPPQIECDGIWMSMDGVNSDLCPGSDPAGEVPLVLEEYKLTWKSNKHSLLDDFYYMCQVKSYCRAIGTNVAVMRVFYIMGNYRGSGPSYRIARIRFTDKELEDNWKMITRHRENFPDCFGIGAYESLDECPSCFVNPECKRTSE